MDRRTFIKVASASSLTMIGGCLGSNTVVNETVIGNGDIFFQAESGDTINLFAEVDGTGRAVGAVANSNGDVLIRETITTETEASAVTTASGEHAVTIAAQPTTTTNVEIATTDSSTSGETQGQTSEEETRQNQKKESIKELVETYFRALENEERNLLISTLHPKSKNYESSIENFNQLSNNYDFKYEHQIHSIEINDGVAEVEVSYAATSPSSDVQDIRDTVVWRVEKYEGEWRLHSSL